MMMTMVVVAVYVCCCEAWERWLAWSMYCSMHGCQGPLCIMCVVGPVEPVHQLLHTAMLHAVPTRLCTGACGHCLFPVPAVRMYNGGAAVRAVWAVWAVWL